jgi:photosystem II stability/assembly factor-like uncharacterized protein
VKLVKGEKDMFRKFALIWALVVLPLAGIIVGCGDDETTSGTTGFGEVEYSTEWTITVQPSGASVVLQEVFADSVTGNVWVVGNDGVILNSTDRGAIWTPQVSGMTGTTLYSIYFVNEIVNGVKGPAEIGWAVGDGGVIIHTEDGGATWEPQVSGITGQLRSVFFADRSNGWAVGAAGLIMATRNGGDEWGTQAEGISNQDLESIDFAPPAIGEVVVSQGWAVGLNATIIHTGDGNRWTKQNPARGLTNEALYGVFFDSSNKGWAIGDLGPMILNTSNGGATWGSSPAHHAGSKNLYDLFFISAADGWAVGSGGKILHMTSAGDWEGVITEVSEGINTPLWGVAFVDGSEGWAVGGTEDDPGIILNIKAQ